MQTYILISVVVLFILSAGIFFLLSKKKSSGTIVADTQKKGLGAKLAGVFSRTSLDESFWSDLETSLIEADVGIDVTTRLIDEVKTLGSADEIKNSLKEKMVAIFSSPQVNQTQTPHVILVLGVNGVGKTTTIAKLSHKYKMSGKKVLLVAGDTFRAAAVEQLKEWGKRLNMDVVAQAIGADSAAVAFDGVEKAKARGYDIVIIDTAGRLHTKQNLMEELKKIGRVISKSISDAPHERILVLDATVGSNGLSQAREFNGIINLTGVIVTKLDGTAKGGIVFAIAGDLNLPITHIGLGEGMEDLKTFSPKEFVDGIF